MTKLSIESRSVRRWIRLLLYLVSQNATGTVLCMVRIKDHFLVVAASVEHSDLEAK